MECRLGWYRALESSAVFDTWVICDEAYRENIEEYQRLNGQIPGLKFCFLPFQQTKSSLDPFGAGYWSYYSAYHDWHRRAFDVASQLNAKFKFDLTHQIGLCGYREPGYLWKLDVPFVWGPVGGTQNLPWRYLKLLDLPGATLEVMRTMANKFHLRFRQRVRQATLRAKKLYAANSTAQADFERVHGVRPELQLETGLQELPLYQVKPRDPSQPFKILWAGRFQPWKALPLLLHALKAVEDDVSFQLRVIGFQDSEAAYRRLATKLGLDQYVEWLGWPAYSDTFQHHEWADVYAFTSLRDTSGTGLLEALAHGSPIIGVNHQGARDIMNSNCAVPIEVGSPDATIDGFRRAILDLSRDNDKLLRLSEGAVDRAREFLWSKLGAKMIEDYSEILGKPQPTPVQGTKARQEYKLPTKHSSF